MSREQYTLSGEPHVVYLDRTAPERANLTDDSQGAGQVERERQVVLDYVDTNLVHSYRAVSSYLAQPPNVSGVRDTERIARHLAAHPLLTAEQRQGIAGLFNENISHYGLDTCVNKKRRVAFIQPAMVELSLPVDDLAEVR